MILLKSISKRVWSPKTKAMRTFMNVVIWRKKYIYYTYDWKNSNTNAFNALLWSIDRNQHISNSNSNFLFFNETLWKLYINVSLQNSDYQLSINDYHDAQYEATISVIIKVYTFKYFVLCKKIYFEETFCSISSFSLMIFLPSHLMYLIYY